MEPKVTLINSIPDPQATLWILWQASKTTEKIALSTQEVRATVSDEKLNELFWNVVKQRIPVGESLVFIFMLENVSVSFREQMVRHRIGLKAGDNFGVDVVPDLAKSSWWSDSMRIRDMGTFADEGAYRVPATLKGKIVRDGGFIANAEDLWADAMKFIQETYKLLVAAGVPMEDARDLIPLGAQTRISWTINLQSLLHVLGKRGCWILQHGLWGPIIRGAVAELAEKVHPSFRTLVEPPCVSDGKFNACLYREENRRRLPSPEWGNNPPDQHPVCPLFLCRDAEGVKYPMHFAGELSGWSRAFALKTHPQDTLPHVPMLKVLQDRAEEYRELWGFNPYYGPDFDSKGNPKEGE